MSGRKQAPVFRPVSRRVDLKADIKFGTMGHDALAQGKDELMVEQKWPIAKEGFPFLIPSALLTIFLGGIGWKVLPLIGILLTLFIAFFFRNPKRKIPSLQNIILSPADGRIIYLGECEEDRFLKKKALSSNSWIILFC